MNAEDLPATHVDAFFLQPWQGSEREDFFSAVKRHRRKAWRITAICLLAYATLAMVISVLLAPLLYGIAGLLLDVVNKLFPTPDLLGFAGRLLDPLLDHPTEIPTGDLLEILLLASAPGLLLTAVAMLMVSRAVTHSALFDSQCGSGRPPDARRLAERQMVNALEEMAVAAMVPAPVVTIIAGGANAAATGIDRRHASIMVGENLLTTLTREEMQGVAGHLIGAIADNDMRIGLRTASLLGLFALIVRLSTDWHDREALASHRKLIRALLSPTPASRAFVLSQLQDPFAASTPRKETVRQSSNTLSWREWLTMPLLGPMVLSGFLAGLVNTMILTPAICYAWRQRKYMADATAVRLTRQPDALAKALTAMNKVNTSLLSTAWASHLCVVDPGSTKMIVPIFPALERRLSALTKLGAGLHHMPTSPRAIALWIKLLIGGLLSIAYCLILTLVPLIAYVSTMLTMLLTLLPVCALHALLR